MPVSLLAQLFEGNDPVIIGDSDALVEPMKAAGWAAMTYQECISAAPQNALVLMNNWEAILSQRSELVSALSESRVATLSMAAFDGSVGTTKYTLDLLWQTDFASCAQKAALWVEEIGTAQSGLHVTSRDSDLMWRLTAEVRVGARIKAELPPGDWTAVAEFLEVEMETRGHRTPEFSLEGEASVTAVLAAHSSTLPPALAADRTEANALVLKVAASEQPLRVGVRNGFVVEAELGGDDLLPTLRRLSNAALDLQVLECAIGLNEVPPEQLDWSLNSPANESVGGFHFAVGDGITGIHIDFICPGVDIVAA